MTHDFAEFVRFEGGTDERVQRACGRAPARLGLRTGAASVARALRLWWAPDLEALSRKPERQRQALRDYAEISPEALAFLALCGGARHRRAVCAACAKLEPAIRARHAAVVVRQLKDKVPEVRRAALQALAVLDPEALARHKEDVAARLKDKVPEVRLAALQALAALEPQAFARHAESVAALLPDATCRSAALATLARLAPAALAGQAEDVAVQLANGAAEVRCAALHAFANLEPAVLVLYAKLVARCLDDGDPEVRLAALDVLAVLDAVNLGPYVKGLAMRLDDADSRVQASAWALFEGLDLVAAAAKVQQVRYNLDRTVLHLAAAAGRFQVCCRLVEAGLPIGVRDSSERGCLPVDLAQEAQHVDVAKYLTTCRTITATRGGAGNAYAAAQADSRQVVRVEWHTLTLPGIAGKVGGLHSLLAVTVQDSIADSAHTYVIEKAARQRGEVASDEVQFENGVHISHWVDVAPNVMKKPIHAVEGSDLFNGTGHEDFCMRSLRAVAVALGPYDVASCNCHHAALAVFNACAKVTARVPHIPNKLLCDGAELLKRLGVNLADSESGAGMSSSQIGRPGAGRFPMNDSGRGRTCPWAAPAARASKWIYHEWDKPPVDMHVEHVELASDGKLVQWAAMRCGSTIYVVFRGTASVFDGIIDLGVVPYDHAAHGVRVHSQMWAALHQRHDDVTNSVMQKVRELRADREDHVVLCGHSLGGGYATLCALDLLHEGVHVSAVRAFGAPQVVVPDWDLPVWRKLQAITTVFINAYDAIPRLPSCLPWISEALPRCISLGPVAGALVSRWKLQERICENLQGKEHILRLYGTVGTLAFIAEGAQRPRLVASAADGSHRALLEALPDPIGKFICDQHTIEAYVTVISGLRG